MNFKSFIIAECSGAALVKSGDDFSVQKITIDHATVNSGLSQSRLYSSIYIIFIWKCASHFWRYFYELFLGIGEAHHG